MYNYLYESLLEIADEKRAVQMAAYMKNHFPFMGVASPARKAITKPVFREMKKEKNVDWDFVQQCFDNEYREMQYIAIDYLCEMTDFLLQKDLLKIKKLITTKSWWDSVDALDVVVGDVVLRFPAAEKTILKWSVDKNMWLRRIAIDHQLLKKEKTNTLLLEKVIQNNFGSKEFFIIKAIGWALRDYSKTNPEWVSAFLEKNKNNLSALSIREAGKFVNRS